MTPNTIKHTKWAQRGLLETPRVQRFEKTCHKVVKRTPKGVHLGARVAPWGHLFPEKGSLEVASEF